MPPQFRLPQQLAQVYGSHVGFNFTSTQNASEVAVTIPTSMEEANRVSFIVENFDAYVDFDTTATTSSMIVRAGTGYSEEGIYIGTNITIRPVTSNEFPTIIGICWGR